MFTQESICKFSFDTHLIVPVGSVPAGHGALAGLRFVFLVSQAGYLLVLCRASNHAVLPVN